MKKDNWKKEEIAEDYCFTCKDGGLLRVCDFKKCLKAYHPQCVDKDDSFLESDERWTCGWHSCLICKKSSTFQCFCCPSSVCRACIKTAEFVRVKKCKTKGFCNNCLRLTIMIEEGKDVDSDGDKVDFKDTETYEFLFKDYWEIVKDEQGLTLLDLHAADALFKRGENYQSESDSYKEELQSEDGEEAFGVALFKDLKGKRSRIMTPKKKYKSKKRTFLGWGSEELIGFLKSIGKDTEQPLTHLDVCEIVKDYCQISNLYQPDKKKKKRQNVVCDERMYNLFRKKKLRPHKIFDLLESHLSESLEFEKEFSFSSEEDGVTLSKKQRTSDTKIQKSDLRRKVIEPAKSCYAAIVASNVNLVYLKKSLVLELLRNPETFDSKVIGSFVRVKNDPKDFYYLPQNTYKLGQVTGIKKASQAYKVGEMSIDFVLCISNLPKDIHVSMLSDDDLEEDELEDLRQLVKKGLFKRPTIAELDRKMRTLHEDITNHWINREIVKLQKQIDRANEKGWRRELHEYIDRREQLRTPEERMRLVNEIPEIIAETESEIEAIASAPPNSNEENKEHSGTSFLENAAEREAQVTEEIITHKTVNLPGKENVTSESHVEVAERKDEGNKAVAGENGSDSLDKVAERKYEGHETGTNGNAEEVVAGGTSVAFIVQKPLDAAFVVERPLDSDIGGNLFAVTEERNISEPGNLPGNENLTSEIDVAYHEKVADRKDKGNEAVARVNGADSHEKVAGRNHEDVSDFVVQKPLNAALVVEKPLDLGTEQQSKSSEVIEIEEDDEAPRDKMPSEVEIINLEEDDDMELRNGSKDNGKATTGACRKIVQATTPKTDKAIWHYVDPSGTEQGPFSLSSLRFWREEGFFDDDFRVWRTGQSREDAILLTKALSAAFS